jgi:ABC-type uncharacterized transport system involved in gliding motility auxiliary subunit
MATGPNSAARPAGSPAARAGLMLAGLGALWVAVNLLAASVLTTSRLDLTEGRLFTLSPATQTLLAGLDAPITIKFYYSKALGTAAPQFGVYAGRVKDLLQEYANTAGGRVKLQVIDPQPFTDAEDEATGYGLQAVPQTEGSGATNVFFGLVGIAADKRTEIIPFFQPDRESVLEYDISRVLSTLATPQKTVVGLLTTLPIDGTVRMNAYGQNQQVPPYIIADQIRSVFETRFLGAQEDRIADDINLLVIIHPTSMDERTLFAVDQYLLAGGKAMIFVDPFSEEAFSTGGQMLGSVAKGSTLEPLFSAWGIRMDPTKVVADRLSARRVSPGPGQPLVEYLPWLELRGASIDSHTAITSGVEIVSVASTGYLDVAEGAPVTLAPLLTSSAGASAVESSSVQGFKDPLKLLRDFKPGNKALVIAGRVTGTVPTAFPDGPPKPPADAGAAPQPDQAALFPRILKASDKPLDVIVVADSDLLADRFWVVVRDFFGRRVPQPTAQNGDFVMNALEALTGSSSLLGLRGRGTANRPFEVIHALQRDAQLRVESKQRSLEDALKEAERQLAQLRQNNPDDNAAAVTPDDRKRMAALQAEVLKLRGELRAVQRALREDLERLEHRLWFLDIAAVPIVITLLAIVLAVVRLRRRRGRVYAAGG